jgi:ABC-2 type transport system permease protein
VGFAWMYIALFPTFSESFEQMKSLIDSFPKAFLDAFGFDPDSFMTFEGFIGSEQFTFIWPIMMITLTISFAGGAIAEEIEKGTIEILLSQSISRIKIFLGKFFAGVAAIVLYVIASIGCIFPLTKIYDITIKSENFLKLGFLCICFGLAIYGLSLLFSAVFSEKGKANFMPAGILILMYVINILAGLQESLRNLKYFSFFYYFNPSKLLVHGELDNLAWFVFLGTFIVSTSLAIFWFNKRDISV